MVFIPGWRGRIFFAFIICTCQVTIPTSSPSLEERGSAKAFTKQVPTATKAAPPMKIQDVARPVTSTCAVPKVCPSAAPAIASPREVPTKRPQPLENTASKVQRLLAEPKAVPSKTARNLMPDLDGVSESKNSPKPDSALVFAHGAPVDPTSPYVQFTPVAPSVAAPSVPPPSLALPDPLPSSAPSPSVLDDTSDTSMHRK